MTTFDRNRDLDSLAIDRTIREIEFALSRCGDRLDWLLAQRSLCETAEDRRAFDASAGHIAASLRRVRVAMELRRLGRALGEIRTLDAETFRIDRLIGGTP